MASRPELKSKDRIRKGLSKYVGILSQAAVRGISEEDTSTIVQSMLVDILGYDRFEDITGQFATRGRWADWAVKSDDVLHFLVEVKPLGAKLRERDLFQVVSYSRQYNLEWAVLTTGDLWQCHRVPAGNDPEQFFEIRLLDAGQSDDEKTDYFYLLSKYGFSRGAIQEQWQRAECFRPLALARILLSDEILRAVRRALRRENPGRKIEVTDVRSAVTRTVIRGDLYNSLQAEEPETHHKPNRSRGDADTVPAVTSRKAASHRQAGRSATLEPWKADGEAWHMQRLGPSIRPAFEQLVEALGDHVSNIGWNQAHYVWLRGKARNLRVHTSVKGGLEIGLHPASEQEATLFLADYPDLGLTPKVAAGYKTSPFIRPAIAPPFPSQRLATMLAHWLDGDVANVERRQSPRPLRRRGAEGV